MAGPKLLGSAMMKRLLTLGIALSALSKAPCAAQESPHVVFLVGEGEYQSQSTMPALAERVEESFGWRTTVLHDQELHAGPGNDMEGLEVLGEADLVVLYLRFRQWPQEDLDALMAYVERGGALVGFRTSTHAFRYESDDPRVEFNDFGAEVLGAPWIRHYGHGASTDATVVGRGGDDGILDGVADEFHVRSWTYHVRPDYPTEDARVLVTGRPVLPGRETEDETINPIAWTRTSPGGGRVFMTTMGHPEDFRVEAFRRLVGNGMHWAAGLGIPDGALEDFPEVVHPDDLEEREAGEEPWVRMDYGPTIATAVGIGEGLAPVAKGIVVRLRNRGGEETDLWAVFDTDLCAWRCAWEGELALRGIVYDGPHGTYPEVEGDVLFRTASVPGVQATGAALGQFRDPRVEVWGPVPPEVCRWHGLHFDGDDVVFEYMAHGDRVRILERVWAEEQDGEWFFAREVSRRPGTSGSPDSEVQVLVLGPELPEDGRSSATLASEGHGIVRGDLIACVVPAEGSVRITVGGPVGEAPKPAAPLGRSLEDALASKRPRWGGPWKTEGVVGMQLGQAPEGTWYSVGPSRDSSSRAIVAGPSGTLSLLHRGERVESGPASECVVLRNGIAPLVDPFGSMAPRERLGHWPADRGNGSHERNEFTGAGDLRLDGVTWRRGVRGRSLDFDGTASAWVEGLDLDFAEQDITVAAWIHTTRDGTVFAMAPGADEDWAPDGVTLFLREGRLAFDVGWVGVVTGGPDLRDGSWHHVAASWRHGTGRVSLFVDSLPVGSGSLALKGHPGRRDYLPRWGWTNRDFPSVSRFSGYMDGLCLLGRALDGELMDDLAAATGEEIVEGTVVRWWGRSKGVPTVTLRRDANEDLAVFASDAMPENEEGAGYFVHRRTGLRSTVLDWARGVEGAPGARDAFRIDRLSWPEENPHDSWMRFGALDLAPSKDGKFQSALLTTWSGDLWRVDGLDRRLEDLSWTRVATGLNQPFGVLHRELPSGNEEILVLGRDQITRVHDANGDGEADFLEAFSNLNRNSEHFHEPASGLLEGPDGSLMYIKAARHAKHGLHSHHGTVQWVSLDGRRTQTIALGFRAPIGLRRLPDGSLLGSDQEGHWTPANRINLIRPSAEEPRFYGNGWAAHPGVEPFGAAPRVRRGGEAVHPAWPFEVEPEPPLCWIHPEVDRSPSSQLLADHPAWGPLEGSILGLSYGTGEVYLVLRDEFEGPGGPVTALGGVVKLGIQLPTGLLDGKIHPETGDLYVCGLFGWSSDRTDAGGFYRVRPQLGRGASSLNVPYRIRATESGLTLTFVEPLDGDSVQDLSNWEVNAWNYRRSADYGSATYGLDGKEGCTRLEVTAAGLSPNPRILHLSIEGLVPCDQLDLGWTLRDARGHALEHRAHLTLHAQRGGSAGRVPR